MSIPTPVETFVAACAGDSPPTVFNPWRERCLHDRHDAAPAQRQARLLAHLSCPDARLILVGEAVGYQGARYSGIPFTSERLLLAGAIPRVPSLHGERITDRPSPFSEPTATTVWGALYAHNLAEHTILWNACPWHPAKTTAVTDAWTNRTPSKAETMAGEPFLRALARLFPKARFAAVGRVAEERLVKGGIRATPLRHPSYGGAPKFREELAALALELGT